MTMKSVVMEGSKLREEAHQIFDWVKSFAKGAEVEIGLGTNVNEGLRFGNNELSQSQYSRRRALSVRVVTNKRQARATTGLLEKNEVEKTVRRPWSRLGLVRKMLICCRCWDHRSINQSTGTIRVLLRRLRSRRPVGLVMRSTWRKRMDCWRLEFLRPMWIITGC